MMDVEMVGLELIGILRRPVEAIARSDRDLASQIRRAASSAVFNVSEGSKRAGKQKLHFFRIAAGSASELRMAVEVARKWGHEIDGTDELVDRLNAMLWRLSHPR